MVDAASPRQYARALRILLPIAAFCLLAGMLMSHIDRPMLARHSWREADTASFARGLARGEFGLLEPRFLAYYPDAFGIDGAAETEFNLYPLLVSLLYKTLGIREILARMTSACFTLGSAVWVYLLAKRLIDWQAGVAAVLLLATSPAWVFYGTSIQPEATVLFLTIGSLCCFLLWSESNRWRYWVAGALMGALAIMTKIPALYIGIPLLSVVLLTRGKSAFRDWRVWLFAFALLAPATVYYANAHNIYQRTGLTVYGINGGWPGSGKFDATGQLLDPGFYRVMLSRLRGLLLGPYGFTLMLIGLLVKPSRKTQWVLVAWLVAVILFVLGVSQGNRQHEYYQLPLVPVAAILVGRAVSALLESRSLGLNLIIGSRHAGLWLSVALLALNLRAGIIYLAPMWEQTDLLLDIAAAAEHYSPQNEPIAILHDWARVPEVFYYADRRGWSLWLERTPEGEYHRLIIAERQRTADGWRVDTVLESSIDRMDTLRDQGASRLVVSLEKGSREEFLRSHVGQQLSERYLLIASDDHWLVYDLS